jgi:cell division protein FtsB
MKRLRFSWKYGLMIGGVILAAYLLMDFNNRVAEMHQFDSQKALVAATVTTLAIENQTLKTQIAEANSEAVVAKWAYQDGHMVRPGDVPVVPLPAVGGTPAPTPTPVVTPPVVSNWQMWVYLFVDPKPANP